MLVENKKFRLVFANPPSKSEKGGVLHDFPSTESQKATLDKKSSPETSIHLARNGMNWKRIPENRKPFLDPRTSKLGVLGSF